MNYDYACAKLSSGFPVEFSLNISWYPDTTVYSNIDFLISRYFLFKCRFLDIIQYSNVYF